jgi:hypothetical protein
MPVSKQPCRLFGIIARKAPVCAILRRGPSKWVQLIKWEMDVDRFWTGQWFHGRIYEKRCDLSPDGTRFLYFAQKLTDPHLADTDYTYAWTAMSKLPYFTALALWPNGHCWNGGGLFETNSTIWLNHPAGTQPHKDHSSFKLKVKAEVYMRGEDDTVQSVRLERDGWTLAKSWRGELSRVHGNIAKKFTERINEARSSDLDWLSELHARQDNSWGYLTFGSERREKKFANGSYSLIMNWALVGFSDHVKFVVRNNLDGAIVQLPRAIWADIDHGGRLVYMKEGKIFSAIPDNGFMLHKEMLDLNQNKPEPIEAPEWAKVW